MRGMPGGRFRDDARRKRWALLVLIGSIVASFLVLGWSGVASADLLTAQFKTSLIAENEGGGRGNSCESDSSLSPYAVNFSLGRSCKGGHATFEEGSRQYRFAPGNRSCLSHRQVSVLHEGAAYLTGVTNAGGSLWLTADRADTPAAGYTNFYIFEPGVYSAQMKRVSFRSVVLKASEARRLGNASAPRYHAQVICAQVQVPLGGGPIWNCAAGSSPQPCGPNEVLAGPKKLSQNPPRADSLPRRWREPGFRSKLTCLAGAEWNSSLRLAAS